MITVFTLPNCPHCEDVKEMLDNQKIVYTVRSMDDAESITDLRFNGCFIMEAPIIQMGDKYLAYKEFIKMKNAD